MVFQTLGWHKECLNRHQARNMAALSEAGKSKQQRQRPRLMEEEGKAPEEQLLGVRGRSETPM